MPLSPAQKIKLHRVRQVANDEQCVAFCASDGKTCAESEVLMGQTCCVSKSREQRVAESKGSAASSFRQGNLRPPPAGACRVYLIRHGFSTHNAQYRDELVKQKASSSPHKASKDKRLVLWDAPLHSTGVKQAALLRQTLRDIPLDLCVT